ncbi:MAG: iron chelate uptake ABC transporter family permease subunit, partial [Oscillospiraceae bacterium]
MYLSQAYLKRRRQQLGLGLGLAVLLFFILLFSVQLGTMRIDTVTIVKIIAGKVLGLSTLLQDIPRNVMAVVWEIRLPRILCSALVGAGLAVAGVIFQAILQNPLADPYTMGVSTGAAFGASLAILCHLLYGIFVPVSLCALGFALATLAELVDYLARQQT